MLSQQPVLPPTGSAALPSPRLPQDNIRALLASLHTVLWEGSGWTPPSMADMVENAKVGGLGAGGDEVGHCEQRA